MDSIDMLMQYRDPPLWAIYVGNLFVTFVCVTSTWLVLKRLQQFASFLLQTTHDLERAKESAHLLALQTQENARQRIANAVARELQTSNAMVSREVIDVAANVQQTLAATNAAVQRSLQEAADARVKLQATLDQIVAKVQP
jgi:hypothetical protein